MVDIEGLSWSLSGKLLTFQQAGKIIQFNDYMYQWLEDGVCILNGQYVTQRNEHLKVDP